MTDAPKFNIIEFLPYLLNQAAEQTSLGFQEKYRQRYGMLRTEWRVLFHLGKYSNLTANDIVIKAKIHKTKVSRAVQALSEKGYVEREEDQADRRREHLLLTKQGLSVYQDLSREAATYERKLVEGLSADEVTTLKKLLSRFAGSI
ncbi:MAG: MarR family winged helix-turn-helix transcriptional regulator [Pseudomonadota bacterium]